jgi:hypothetical protein
MSMPDDIPQDVRAIAEAVAKEATRDAMRDPLMPYYITVWPHIARAIMAAKAEEREECAEHLITVAKATPLGHENQQRGKSTYNWLVYCADLIRKHGEA